MRMKRQVWHAVLHGKQVLANAETFVNVAEQLSPKITVLHHSSDSVRRATEHLPERRKNCKLIYGTPFPQGNWLVHNFLW